MSEPTNPSSTAGPVVGKSDVVRPAVFIGLGSTGGKIISRLKRFLVTSDEGGGSWASDFYAFLRVTSEVDAEAGTDTNIPAVPLSSRGLTPRTVLSLLGDNANADVKAAFEAWWLTDGSPEHKATGARSRARREPEPEWWVPPVQNFDKGVGGSRPSGRLLLHSACLRPDLDAALNGIGASFRNAREKLPVHLRPRISKNDVDFYVFGLLAGGTCSGSILDLAYLIRNRYPTSYVLSVLLLGDVCYEGATALESQPHRRDMQRDNTTHALAELGFAQSPYGRQVLKKEWVTRIGSTSLDASVFDASPFHRVTVVGAINDEGVRLPRFDDYVSFVADYYGALFASEINARESGRRVDDEATQFNVIEKGREYRPSTMDRIGLLSIAAPREKLEALAKAHFAIEFAAHHIKNADAARWQASQNQFQSRISWEALHKILGPQAPFQISSPGTAGTKAEFRTLWTDQKAGLDAFYGSWVPKAKDAGKKDPKGEARFESQAKAFETTWRNALDGCVADLLGETGAPFSLGSLKALLVSLEALVAARINALDTKKNELEAKVFGEKGFETAFKSRLESATDGFPEGTLGFLKRRNYTGGAEVRHALESYGKALHDLALTQAALSSLPALLDHIRVLRMARHAVGKLCAEDVLTRLQERPNELFDEVEGRRGLRREVISDKATILADLLGPILSRDAEGGTLEEKTRLALASCWAAAGRTPAGALRKIGEILSSSRDVRTEEKAERHAEVRKVAEPLRAALDGAFLDETGPMRDVVAVIEKITIWDAIRCYVEKLPEGEDREQVVTNMFKAWAEHAGLFPKAESIAAKDDFQKSTYFYYVCDTSQAEACFTDLGIKNAGTFLGRVMQQAFGGNPAPLSGARDKILVLRAEVGLLPFYYEGLGDGVRALLTGEGRGDDRSWSDARFPRWMAGWWKAWGEHQRLLGGTERPAAKKAPSRPPRSGRR